MNFKPVHICIIQPMGYVHALGFLDQARYIRSQMRRFGVTVTLAKNRLRHDVVNIILGAHLGFDPELKKRYACVFVNLEQMGQTGTASASGEYLNLLGSSAVLDYHPSNPKFYTEHVEDVPIIGFGPAPYLEPSNLDLCDRPIDILFFGSMNARRQAIIADIERAGVSVSVVDSPLYGPERDQLIASAKAVLNCHYYESAIFEQARAFHCLSLGTPVISERLPHTQVPDHFEQAIHWVESGQWGKFINEIFKTDLFEERSLEYFEKFFHVELLDQYADAFLFVQSYATKYLEVQVTKEVWRPDRINIGSGRDYRSGWLNIDILDKAMPDIILDLGQQQSWPQQFESDIVGRVLLEEGSVGHIYASNVLEHVPDLPTFMTNCLKLLRNGAVMEIEVPYEHAQTAWQDPTHIRAMNEMSWAYYTDWFWYLGWFEYRFDIQNFGYLNRSLKPCDRQDAHFMRVNLVKKSTTYAERMTARTMQADFGGISDDI